MPYPPTNDLYELASSMNERDAALVRAAADELIERRNAMALHDQEIGSLRAAFRVNILRLAPQTPHAEIDELIAAI